MTPKEKAIDFRFKFFNEIGTINKHIAKQCALIAVDEILNHKNNFIQTQFQFTYWQEIKQEIEKL